MTLQEKEKHYTELLNNATKSEDRILPYLGLSWIYTHSDKHKALQTSQKALNLARQSGNDRVYGHCLHSLAESYVLMDEMERAIELYTQAAEVARSVEDYKHAVQSEARKSFALLQIGKINQALELALRSWPCARDHGDEYTKGTHLVWLGSLYLEQNDKVSALRYFLRGARILERCGQDANAAWANSLIAEALQSEGEYNEALPAALHSVRLARASGNLLIEAGCLQILAATLAYLGKRDMRDDYKRLAIMSIQRSIRISEDIYNAHAKVTDQAIRGEVYRLCGKFEVATRMLHEALQSALQIQNCVHTGSIFLSLGKLQHELGDLDSAHAHLQQALNFSSSQKSRVSKVAILQELMLLSESQGKTQEALQYCKSIITLHNSKTQEHMSREMASMRERINLTRLRAQRDKQVQRGRELQTNVNSLQRKSSKASLVIARDHNVLTETHNKLKELIRQAERPEMAQELRILANQIHKYISDSSQDFDSEQEFTLANNEYLQGLSHRFPKLTATDLKVCTLVRMQLSSKDIANLLKVEPRTVEVYRTRIRRKLSLPRRSCLTTFLHSIA